MPWTSEEAQFPTPTTATLILATRSSSLAAHRETHRRQEANNAERNQFNRLCNNSDDRIGSARWGRLRKFLPLPAELAASFCCFSSWPRRNRRNAATAASSAVIPATFSAR